MTDEHFNRGERYESTREAWEEIWNEANLNVELEAIKSDRAQETLQAYLPYLPHDRIVLEAGSGLNAVVITLQEMGYQVVGLDYAVNALRVSREHVPDLNVVAGDVHALPHPDESLGAYLSFGVLEHFEHGMQPALKEAYRVLLPDGVLVLTIPYPNVVYKLVQLKRRLTGAPELTNEDFFESVYTREELMQEVVQAGFRVEEVIPTSHSFTLWGLGGPFRANGYYKTTGFADTLGKAAKRLAPWMFNFMTLIIARK